MTSNSQFKAQFWQQVDDYFWVFIQNTKPVNAAHALRLQIAKLSYRLLGPRYFYVWARKNQKLRTFLIDHFDIEALDELYGWLSDDYSRQMMIKLIARKLIHDSPYLAPLIDRARENAAYDKAESLITVKNTHTISVDGHSWVVNDYDLSSIGYDINLHLNKGQIARTFLIQQYLYNHNNINVGVEKGDIVIDGGGCWGDTSIYMVAKGAERAYCFEFSDENLNILNKNFAGNPKLAEHITLVQKAIWNIDGKKLNFEADGPATTVVEGTSAINPVETITIDTFVEQMKIERVDLIKMDIEGAEMNALHGARKTIARFAPKLAITVYHKLEDLFTIPQLIKSMRPDYELYLDHFTTGTSETVLFAVSREGRVLVSQAHITEAEAPMANDPAV